MPVELGGQGVLAFYFEGEFAFSEVLEIQGEQLGRGSKQ